MDIVVDTNVLVAGLRSRNGASNALLHKIRDRKGFLRGQALIIDI